MRKYLLLFLIGISGLFVSESSSYAGKRETSTVTVDNVNRIAFGSLGDARNSSDNYQLIGCILTSGSSVRLNCYATNSSNVSASCTLTTVPTAMLNAATSISPNSKIIFTWDSFGACKSLTVYSMSIYSPMR